MPNYEVSLFFIYWALIFIAHYLREISKTLKENKRKE
jgi:hypothetical protein